MDKKPVVIKKTHIVTLKKTEPIVIKKLQLFDNKNTQYTNNLSKFPVLLSYPRSGNHLTRFFIELLTQNPTYGSGGKSNTKDIPIYKNIFPVKIPFNIKDGVNKKEKTYVKYHFTYNLQHHKVSSLIFLLRNPREVLLRHNGLDKLSIPEYQKYFDGIDFFLQYKGPKLLLYYEDMLTQKTDFINKLYFFLDDDALPHKLSYALSNIEELFIYSSQGENRAWGGNRSNFNTNYYYDKISPTIKDDFDAYLRSKLKDKKYQFIIKKYNL